MADDPRLGQFLDQWSRDQRDGITIRSVHNKVTGHLQRYDKDQQETRDRIKSLEVKNELAEKQQAQSAFAEAIAEETGKHRVVPTPVQSFTPAFGTMVPVELRALPPPPAAHEPEKKKHSGFFHSAFKAAKTHGGTAAGAAAITLLISFLAGRGCAPAQAIEKAEKPAASAR